jgi:hypothetical protein
VSILKAAAQAERPAKSTSPEFHNKERAETLERLALKLEQILPT